MELSVDDGSSIVIGPGDVADRFAVPFTAVSLVRSYVLRRLLTELGDIELAICITIAAVM